MAGLRSRASVTARRSSSGTSGSGLPPRRRSERRGPTRTTQPMTPRAPHSGCLAARSQGPRRRHCGRCRKDRGRSATDRGSRLCMSLRLHVQLFLFVLFVLRGLLFLTLFLVLLALVSHDAPPAPIVHQSSSVSEWIVTVLSDAGGSPRWQPNPASALEARRIAANGCVKPRVDPDLLRRDGVNQLPVATLADPLFHETRGPKSADQLCPSHSRQA